MKKMRIIISASALALATLMYSCGGGEAAQGEPLDWSKIEDNTMAGKTVTIEGYAELPFLMYTSEGRSTLHLHPRMNQYGGGMVILSVLDGTDENTMDVLPDDYASTDLVLHDNTGKKIVYGEKMKVTGKATWEDGQYHIDVETIEKAEGEYDYSKEAVRLTDSSDYEKLDQKMVWAEGYVYIADEQQSGIRMDVWLDDTTMFSETMCKLAYGPLKNQADELPESYSEDDVVYRDAKGKELGDGDYVRVYGVWYNDKELIAVEKIEAVE